MSDKGYLFFKECREYCNLPTEFPPETDEWNRLLWDGKSPFKLGMAETHRIGMAKDEGNYAVVAHDLGESEPYIKKSFGGGTLAVHTEGDKKGQKMFGKIWVVPEYGNIPNSKIVKPAITTQYNEGDVVKPAITETKVKAEELKPDIVDIEIPAIQTPKKEVILPTESVEKTDWLVSGIDSREDAVKWLTARGLAQGIHFAKDEKLVEKIRAELNRADAENKDTNTNK